MAIVWKWGLNWNANALVWPNGTATNVTWVDWKSNWAGSFYWLGNNTTTSRIIIWSVANISTWFTISALAKTNSLTYQQSIFWIDTNIWWPEISILTNWTVRLNKGYQALVLNPTTVLSVNTWYNIASTYNWTTASIYINWTLIWSTTTSSFSNVNKRIGSSWGDNYSFNWIIDEVEIHNTALSPAEIKNKYLFYNWFI
jgi:hypothetical protein